MLDYQLMYMRLKNVAAKVWINCGQITSQVSVTEKISRFTNSYKKQPNATRKSPYLKMFCSDGLM